MDVAFSPDGKTLVVASGDGKVRLRDVASGQLRGQTVEQGSPIIHVALSPDGRTILTSGFDKTARLWDADTGRPVGQPMLHPGGVWGVAFSPDGKTLLTGSSYQTARVWDAHTGRPISLHLEQAEPMPSVAFSPDGKTILTGGIDRTARLWDVATGQPIGPPLVHWGPVASVALSPDGQTVLTGSRTGRRDSGTPRPAGPSANPWNIRIWWGRWRSAPTARPSSPAVRTLRPGYGIPSPAGPSAGPCRMLLHDPDGMCAAFSPDGRFVLTNDLRTARLWDVPAPLPEDLPRLAAWVETATGLELDERGSIHVLDRAVWLERRSRLEQLGGPPPPDPASRLDPILFGADPAARGDAWKQRGHRDRAEEAYAEAIRARPLDQSVWDALARLHAERGQLDRAAATLAEAVRRIPEDAGLRRRWGLALLESGDRSGWQGATAALLDRLGSTINPRTASDVAWVCASGPDATGDPDRPLRLAEAAVEGAEERFKADALRTLGAALYRAGRYDEAIRRLEEGNRLPGGEGLPSAWPFLAMAHHRLGHRDEARRWLDRLGERQPSLDSHGGKNGVGYDAIHKRSKIRRSGFSPGFQVVLA